MTYSGEETGLLGHKVGFTTNKLRVDDYDTLLDHGFTRCGCYCYVRNNILSCCECYQYKVLISDFKMSKSQKHTMKRFHRYLETGSVNLFPKQNPEDAKMQNEESKDKPQLKPDAL